MGKRTPFFWGKREIRDARTGREIWQMTAGKASSHSPYMYARAFSHNEKYLLASSDRTGLFQMYRIDIETGEAVQLTDVEHYENMGLVVEHTGKEVYYVAGKQVRAVEIESGEERIITDLSGLHQDEPLYPRPCIRCDGKVVFLPYKRKDGRMCLAMADASGSKPETVYVFPFDKVSHPLCHPTDQDVITFVPPDRQNEFSLPPELRARAWKLNLATEEAEPFLVAPTGFRATHEYWAPDGSRLYFHVKGVPDWFPASIASMDKAGGEWQTHITSDSIKLGHSAINRSQTHIVGDSQQAGSNELVLLDLATSEYEVLCWPNASGRPHPNHVHPNFSPSGNYVIYTSDVTGSAQVYLVPLHC